MTPEQAAAAAMREKAAQTIEPKNDRGCDCDPGACYCQNYGDAEMVARWDESNSNAAAIRAIPLPEAKADPRGLGQREANPTGSVSAACSQTQDYALNAEGSGRVCSVDPRDEALAQASGALNAGILALDPVNSSQLMRAERQMRTALAAIETAQKGGV